MGIKVLFVRSGNNGDDPISKNQGKSLLQSGLFLNYYDIVGKGVFGYLLNINKLKKYIKIFQPDIIHAHYSFCGFISSLTFSGVPTGVSLMGSDVNNSDKFMKVLIKAFSKYLWAFTIVKSEEMYNRLNFDEAILLPNGVSFNDFYPLDIKIAREKLEWDLSFGNIIFASDPSRPEKNFKLAKQTLDLLEKKQIRFHLHFLKNILPSEMIFYYNAADLLLLTSDYEGSPNVIKEAMACNCPIVSTDVGDVKNIINNTDGCFITSFDPVDIADKIISAINFGKRTNGREHISHLNSNIIAHKLLDLYEDVLNRRTK